MKRTILTLTLVCIALGASAQGFDVPSGYKFDKPEDYKAHEENVVKCFDWIMATPAREEASTRDKASKFLTAWLMGSPSVSIKVNQSIVTFTNNADMLMIFMGGWAKYAIESKDNNNSVEGNLKGLEAVIDYYQNNVDYLGKDKNIEKYIKLKDKGKLRNFVEKNA